MSSKNQRNVKWVEGLRGITSFFVVMTHMARAWDYSLFWPSDAPGVPPRFLQLPIIRIPFQGRIGVPIFAFLTGFVCAYKPLRLAYHQGNLPGSLHSIARSAFRRVPRLVLPAAFATFISFVLAILGAYTPASHSDSHWVRYDSPDPDVHTLDGHIRRLFRALLSTWTVGENVYDRHQWAMRPLLIGAFQVYLTLAATIGMRFKYRITVYVLLLTYWLVNIKEMAETFGANITLGTLLAELSLHRPTQNFIAAHARILTFVVAPPLILFALYLGSYPHENEAWQPWSENMYRTFVDPVGDGSRGTIIVPNGSFPPTRMTSACVQLCATAIFLSPTLREALSHRWLMWLGNHSFAVYLIHGTILRTVGMWIVYGFSLDKFVPAGSRGEGDPPEPEWLQPRSRSHKQVAIVVFLSLTYLAAWAWMKYVDTTCANITMWLEKRVFDEDDGSGKDGLAEKGLLNGDAESDRNSPTS